MSEKTAPTFPFTLPFGVDAMRKVMTDAQERWGSLVDDAAKLEGHGMSHARTMVDESAKLAHETLNYWTNLHNEWRKVATEATKRSLDLVSPR
jgi:hypothetical protein